MTLSIIGSSLFLIGITLCIALICCLLYFVFPLRIISTDRNKQDKVYRHEFLIFFFVIFVVYMWAALPTMLYEDECTPVVQSSTRTINYMNLTNIGSGRLNETGVIRNETINYIYTNLCNSQLSTNYKVSYQIINIMYARFRWFMWLYLAGYTFFYLFIIIHNWIVLKRRGEL